MSLLGYLVTMHKIRNVTSQDKEKSSFTVLCFVIKMLPSRGNGKTLTNRTTWIFNMNFFFLTPAQG